TLHLTVISTCKAISSLKTDYIKFPENRTEMDAIAEEFHKRCGMPGVVGAIDGNHIAVPAPTSEHRASFINGKGFSSIQLQVVCDTSMLVPYRDNGHLDPVQKKFNKVHSSTRVDVERAIGLLKCKFRRLKSLDMHLQEEIPEVITACCVVHNVILDCEMVEEEITLDDAVDNSASDQDSQTRQASSHGETKRRRIANML
ncbi:putative nuclease HARBI1, partial [Ruditapes philippinarum]|uniref:putative nuclease HARBI1 n=1 Tax=Ruditapes philippinarum TaxID=129788 RepID=UPI00295C2B1A